MNPLLMLRLLQTVKGVAKAARLSEDDLDERILIHICYSPRRYVTSCIILITCACNIYVMRALTKYLICLGGHVEVAH